MRGDFAIFPLLILLLLAAGLIVAFIKSKTLGRWIIAGVVIFLVMLLMPMSVRRTPLPIPEERPAPTRLYQDGASATVQMTSNSSTPAIWMPGAMENFQADVYPSLPAAARALARNVAQNIPNMISDPKAQPKVIIQFVYSDIAIEPVVPNAIVQGLRDENDNLVIELAEINQNLPAPQTVDKPEVIILKVSFVGTDSRSINLGPERFLQESGTVSMEARGKAGRLAINSKYTQKLWMESFANFKNRFPEHNWLLARSNSAAGNDSSARSQAEQNAVNQIWDQLHLQNRRLKSMRRKLNTFTPLDLRKHGLIVDSFSQSFTGTAGPIWREALLIDASPVKLDALQATNDANRRDFLQQLLSLLGMIAIVCVIYVFINFATKGYYKLALRVMAALLVGVGLIIVLLLN